LSTATGLQVSIAWALQESNVVCINQPPSAPSEGLGEGPRPVSLHIPGFERKCPDCFGRQPLHASLRNRAAWRLSVTDNRTQTRPELLVCFESKAPAIVPAHLKTVLPPARTTLRRSLALVNCTILSSVYEFTRTADTGGCKNQNAATQLCMCKKEPTGERGEEKRI
jgi:hypothetical protein